MFLKKETREKILDSLRFYILLHMCWFSTFGIAMSFRFCGDYGAQMSEHVPMFVIFIGRSPLFDTKCFFCAITLALLIYFSALFLCLYLYKIEFVKKNIFIIFYFTIIILFSYILHVTS